MINDQTINGRRSGSGVVEVWRQAKIEEICKDKSEDSRRKTIEANQCRQPSQTETEEKHEEKDK